MASKVWGLHGGGLKLLTSVLLALSKPQAIHCGTSAGSTAHHDRLATAATPAEDITPPAESGSRSRAEPALSVAIPPREPATGNAPLEVQMLDFSFSPLGPRGLQDTDIDAAGVVEEGQQHRHSNTNPPPSALSLRECSLGDLGVAEVARSPWVRGKAGVRALSLRQNQVTAAGVRALLDSLRSATDSGDRLACLELDFNPIGDAGAQPLPAYLKERAARGGGGLEELSLRFCDIGPAGCRYLSSALLKSAAAAKIAANDDANNPASEAPTTAGSGAGREEEEAEGEKKGGAEVGLPPPVASGIRRLLLTGNDRLGDAGAKALASALKKDSSLQVLDLTRCKIGDDGARCLANALRSNSCLRELRLGYNDISADGAVALASLLHAGSGALECLELQGNHVGDAGAVALADGLVGGNKRGGRRGGGASKQGSSSRRGPGLRSLNLAGNGIGCAGGGALAKALVGGKGGGGEGGVVLEELELAGNALTLSASQAAAQAKSSSLYKSAGGALSSLLTTFVDESYYSSNTNNRGSGQDASALTPPSLGNPTGGVAERPLRCAVAELGETLAGQGARGRGGGGGRGGGNGGGCSSLKAVGLARTGLTERDAARLAAALRARPVDSPLEEVEVGLNGLSVKAAEAVRLAVESPTAPHDRSSSFDDDLENSGGRGRQRPRRQRQQRRRHRDSAAPGGDAGEKPGLRSRRGAAAAAAAEERSARRSEVGKYVPPGVSVELGLFGKKFASFQQAGGSGRELDVEVFGKRVRFERTGGSPPSPRPGSSPPPSMATAELDPWSDDNDGGGGVDDDSDLDGVSAAATDGSVSSWSSEEEDDDDDGRGHEGGRDDSRGGKGPAVLGSDDPENTSISSAADDTEDWDDGGETSDGGDDEERGLDSSAAGRGKPGRRNPASRRNFNVRGGGGGGGGGGEPPIKLPDRRLWSSRDAGGADDGEWAAGFETVSAKETEADCENGMDGSGAAKVEWEGGFRESKTEQGAEDSEDDEWAAGFEAVSEEAESDCESAMGGGGAASAEVEWEDGFRESRTEQGAEDSDDGEWAAGFEAVSEEAESDCESAMGGGGGESAEVEWEDSFREPSESRTEGAEDSDDGERAAGFALASAKEAESDCESAMGSGGAESAEVEWEVGFRESRREQGAEDGEWAAGFEPMSAEETGRNTAADRG